MTVMEFVSREGIEVVPGTVYLVDCKLPLSFGMGLSWILYLRIPELTMSIYSAGDDEPSKELQPTRHRFDTTTI
jgi:hypothetical protein